MEGITLLTKGLRSSSNPKKDDSSDSHEDDNIDISSHSVQSMVSFLSMGGDNALLLDELDDSVDATSQATNHEEEQSEDDEEDDEILARSSDSSLSSQSGDSIVESGESDPSSDDDEDDTSFAEQEQEEEEEEPSEVTLPSPMKKPMPARGLIRMASSDSLFGGVCKFFQRGGGGNKATKKEEDLKKEMPASRTRRGGKRGETSSSFEQKSNNNNKTRGVARTNTGDSLVKASRKKTSADPQRGVQRTSTSDSLTVVDPKVHSNPVHAAKTRRGGKRRSNNETPDSPEPTRGVMRTSTSDSLGGVDTKNHTNPIHTVKTRRGGRKSDSITNNNETSETSEHSGQNSATREPTRGVMRTSTSDSLGDAGMKTTAGRTRRGGKRNTTGGEDTSESVSESGSQEPSRGVARTSTSDSLTGVDTGKHANALHGAKTRRGGRRNQNNDGSENVDHSTSSNTSGHVSTSSNTEPSRGVVRTSTSDSLTGVDTKRATFPRQTSKTRRGGRRNRTNGEQGDGSEGFDTSEYGADTSENAESESKIPTLVHAGSKTRRGGRRNAQKTEDNSEASETKETVPRMNTVDSLLGTFGLERKRGVQRTTTSDSLTGLDTKTNKPVRGGAKATPMTSDESTEGMEPPRSKTTVEKVLGAFGLQRGVARTSTSDSLTGVDTKKSRNKDVHASRTRRGGRRNRGNGEDESEWSENPESAGSPQGKVVRTDTSDSWAKRLMKRPLPRTLTADSLQGADPHKHDNIPAGTKTRRGSRRPHNEEGKECDDEASDANEDGDDTEEENDPLKLTTLTAEIHAIDSNEVLAADADRVLQ